MIDTAIRSTVYSHDVDLGAGVGVLRATLTVQDNGDPATLILARGFGAGEEFTRPSWHSEPMLLPASILAELVDALSALASYSPPEKRG